MILHIDGQLKPYYVQTLAMIFFPGVKFPDGEEPGADVPEAWISLEEDGSGVCASVRLFVPGAGERRETTGSAQVPWTAGNGERDRVRKLAAGEAFLEAGRELTGIRPPWGIMTGVRPAKVATELFRAGYSLDEAAAAIARDYLTEANKARLAAEVSLAESALVTPQSRKQCSVYVGIPFCPTRCAYCSFVSYTSPGLLKLIPEYLEALFNDVDGVFSVIREMGLGIASVYIGGGTPTVLTAEQLSALLGRIGRNLAALGAKPLEYTLEAGRPDTITEEKMAAAVEAGVTRISVNPQSLNPEVLAAIGRAHTPEMFFDAYRIVRDSGVRDINVDLIAGLPADTPQSFRATVDGVSALDPENVTIHTFSVKKSSEFRAEGRFDPSSVIAAQSVDYADSALRASGYIPYYMYRQKNTVGNLENVGWAKPGHEGLYNVYMMEEIHSIFASGAHAVTKLVSEPEEDGSVRIERLFQPKYPYEYLREYRAENGERLNALRSAARAFFASPENREENTIENH
jgi:oxygen-independent coproporphyrinogen-3 oxidase